MNNNINNFNINTNKSFSENIIFIIVFLLFGIIFTYIGISETKSLEKITKNYIETEGKYIGSKQINEDLSMHYYEYSVNDRKYTISTDYSSATKPKKNSKKTIKYNPSNPNIAVIKEFNSNISFAILGIIFIIMSLFFITQSFSILKKYQFLFIGLIFIGLAGTILYIFYIDNTKITPILFLIILLSISMIILGFKMIISNIFLKKQKNLK